MGDLFESYVTSIPSSKKTPRESSSSSSSPSFPSNEIGEMEEVMNFAHYLTSKFQIEKGGDESERKNELEKYLSESCENDDPNFDILQWWKDRTKTYLILQLMAQDVLAIPVSTVTSESAFSTGGRVLDSFRTSFSTKWWRHLFVLKIGFRLLRILFLLKKIYLNWRIWKMV
uniref:HAT C-terminal dimerisation domain-containing protein n=1 Tax=Chenopodium quinoa TaxID=63459 RepID=A0A803N8I2_CHEQI